MDRDARLAAQATRLLHEHPALYGQHIDATARDGVVWLTGEVDRTECARAARVAARLIPGVRSVVDGLQLRPGRAGARAASGVRAASGAGWTAS